MSLEAAIQSLADAIRDHAAALRGQGVLPLGRDPEDIRRKFESMIYEFLSTGPQGPQDSSAVETPVSGDRVAETVETPKRGRGRPPKNAPPVPPAPVEPIVETMPLDAEDLQRTLDDYIQQSRDAEAEGPVQPEPERAPIGAESEPEPPAVTDDLSPARRRLLSDAPFTRDEVRDLLMNAARPIPTIGTPGCQRIIQEHGGVAKLSEVPEDKLRAVYAAAVDAIEGPADDLG